MSKYLGAERFEHDFQARIGVLLVNLGTPSAATPAAVRSFLDEFLSDPRVVEIPRVLWWLILHGVILRIRPRKVAKAYQAVWQQEGSPLLNISRKTSTSLQRELDRHYPGYFDVHLAMRYGKPSIQEGLDELRARHCRHLLVLPLFPQYSATTTASVFDAVTRQLQRWRMLPQLRMPMHYHDHPDYIEALAGSVEQSWQSDGRGEQLIMSFHGLPERYLKAGDPYFCECMKTARLLADRLGLEQQQWQVAFQSRFGREPWLQPYLDKMLEGLPSSGVKSIDVICPGFAADCLETLEEVAMQNRELFMAAGGERYQYIAALNDAPAHVAMLAGLVERECRSWMPEIEGGNANETRQARQQRANAHGAVS